MAVTLSDVARKAGVSTAAASVVLNGAKTATRVSAETRQRIEATARELNYVPNAVARGLARRQTGTIGLLTQRFRIDDSPQTFGMEALQGVLDACEEAGRHLTVFSARLFELDADLTPLAEGRCDGLVIVAPFWNSPLLPYLQERQIPAVVIGHHGAPPQIPSVMVDNAGGVEASLKHLLERGYRRLAFLAGDERYCDAIERRETFESFIAHQSLSGEVIPKASSRDGARTATTRLLSRPRAERPDAIVAWNDAAAIGALSAAREAGISLPDELAVVGFDNITTSEQQTPPLTTVHQPFLKMGHQAAHTLFDLLEQRPTAPVQRIATTLIVRRSTR
jgi:LacI family transcriptional regulator